MWYPPTVTATPANEPVSLEEAKAHLRVFHTDDDVYIGSLISVARDHVEKYCGAQWAAVEMSANCDDWCDLAWLPVSPVISLTSISYIDSDGASAAVDSAIYEFRADARAVVLKSGQVWPARQHGTRIVVAMDVGADEVPPAVKHALLLLISDTYERRETEISADRTTFDNLLANYRYY